MTAQQMLLTDKAVALLPLAGDTRYKARDTELSGFFVHVGKRSKTFMAEGEYWRDGVCELRVQVKLGEFGEIATREARAKAKDVIGQIARGQRPGDNPSPRKAR